MKDFFRRNSVVLGVVVTLGSEAIVALLLWLGLTIAGISPMEHIRWFGGCFIPPVLLLRHYAKKKEYPVVTKTIIITLFITFLAFMFLIRKEFM